MNDPAAMLVARIEAAFAGIRPGRVGLHEAEARDDYRVERELDAARARDAETDWRNIPDSSVAECAHALPYFDPEGWRFHIPAYLTWVLRHPGSNSLVVAHTTYTLVLDAFDDPQHDDERSRARFATLSPAQIEAVRDYLRFIAERDDNEADDARKALDQYWVRAARS